MTGTHPKDPLLSVANLHKTLIGNHILQGIDLTVEQGEIHALMGGNGAGKSTLIKCLSGYWTIDKGAIRVNGAPLQKGAGQIAFVQQDLGLIPSFSVAENISLGVGYRTGPLANIRWREMNAAAAALLANLGHANIDPRAEIASLNLVQRTAVAIARATQGLNDGARLLVLDEPTAALPSTEIGALFETLERLRATGIGMIYVSHHLSEVFRLCDRISVLREGRMIATKATTTTSEAEIVEMMLGRKLQKTVKERAAKETQVAKPVLTLTDVCGERTKDINLTIRQGEVVGLTGLQGSGCTELAEIIFGAHPCRAGHMVLNGNPVAFAHPAQAVAAGVGLVTEDRHGNGSFAELSVGENMTATDLRRFFRKGWLNGAAEGTEVDSLIREFDVRPANGKRRFSSFSGGNQQKAILAKWMRLQPKLLICDQPDIGVDIGSRNAIYAALHDAAAKGSAVIVISNQHDDLEAICDRVLIMRAGRIVAELSGAEATEHKISLATIGTQTPVKEPLP
ncbi:MAG: sugar ABC transporter ATP-binding protein [Paracoccaceae bacterium]